MIKLPENDSNGLTAVDLFCGAGVGAYGIKHAGYNILLGIDNDSYAVNTYNNNIGNHAIVCDVRTLEAKDIPKHDLMIATPVCKPFSVCGARRLTDDEKYGDLLAETIRLFSASKPKALFFENVAGIAMGDSLPIFKEFCRKLESFGYHTYWSLVNCFDLGVPQERVRMLLVAISDDVEFEFIPPKKLLFNKTTQRDAFYDLRDIRDKSIKNHNVDNVCNFDNNFSVKQRQRGWDEPGFTVISDMDSAQYYPEPIFTDKTDINKRPRRLSVREHLRLQTVGDDFVFDNSIPIKEQYNRCSGIPSLVSYKYGVAIADCLLGKTEIRKHTIKKKALF